MTRLKRAMIAVVFAMATAVAVAAAFACADSRPEPTPVAEEAVAGSPALVLDKVQVDLGVLPLGQEAIQTFLVSNRGEVPLNVASVTVEVEEGAGPAAVSAGVRQVPPGQAALVSIKLGKHQQAGPHKVVVRIASDDPVRPVVVASVRYVVAEDRAAPGAGPRLRVDKDSIDIGTVPVDSPLYEQFILRNQGDAPLVLEGAPKIRVEEGC